MPITFASRRPLSRRAFLRGAGVTLALPLLDAMVPAFSRGGNPATAGAARRMVAIETNMGVLPQLFFPEQAGANYQPSPYLQILNQHLDHCTVFSGLSHPFVDGGHLAEQVFLTAAPHPASGAFKNAISLDQLAAEQLGGLTRFPSLTTRVGTDSMSLSYTRGGVKIPAESSPSALYRRMFVQGSPRDVKNRVEDLRRGRSVLDFVTASAKRLERDLGPKDHDRLDQYFTSVRDLENQLQKNEEWEAKPKPVVASPEPGPVGRGQFWAWCRLMYDVVRLALETDSTRLVTIFVNTVGVATDIPGVTHETHGLTHHGFRPEAMAELQKIEQVLFLVLNDFLTGLQAARDGDATLLDRTMVLYGSCLGNAHSHSNVNLPILLAGGGFKHGLHLAFDRQRNYPLPNLFVSMLQRLGLEIDKFASSTGTMRGLEML